VFTARDMVWMLVVPGAIGLLLSILGVFLKNRAWTAPLAVTLAFLATFSFLTGHFERPQIIPPPSMGAKGWLPSIALLGLLVGLIDSFVRLPSSVKALFVAIFTAAGLGLLLKFKFAAETWTPPQGAIAIAAFAIAAAIWCYILEDVTSQTPVTSLLVAWLICSCVGFVLLLIATLDFGQLGISLAACAFAFLPATIWKRSAGALRGLSAILAILIVSLLAGAYYTSELGTLQLLILLSIPIFLWLGRWLPIRSKPWQRSAARIAVTLIPLIVAVTLATIRFQHEQQQQQQDEYPY
jgi:hypothetical protein